MKTLTRNELNDSNLNNSDVLFDIVSIFTHDDAEKIESIVDDVVDYFNSERLELNIDDKTARKLLSESTTINEIGTKIRIERDDEYAFFWDIDDENWLQSKKLESAKILGYKACQATNYEDKEVFLVDNSLKS